MGPHAPRADATPKVVNHAEEETKRLAKILGPDWHAWPTRSYPGTTSWSALPAGARTAVITEAADPEELIAAVMEYTSNLAAHIEETKAELEATGPTFVGRISVLQSRLDALIRLRDHPAPASP